MSKKFICGALMVLLMWAVGAGAGASTSRSSLPQATWLWDSTLIQKNPNGVLSFLQEERISLIYLHIDQNIPMKAYLEFNQAAAKQEIQVYALWGEPYWVTSVGRRESNSAKEWLRAYQKSAHENQKFVGIHLDVEPYLLPNWKNDQQKLVLAYQELIFDWVKEADKQHLTLGVDIPFWFNEIHWVKPSLSSWMIHHVDSLTIMSYRNYISGPNGVLEITRKDREYASKIGKNIFLALETEPSKEGNNISYASYPALHAAIRELEQKCESLAGISMHHLVSLKKLRENNLIH